MNIQKTVWISPIEPHPLSFRAPMGMETRLNVNFLGQNGVPYSSDLGAQLQLTGRSTARTTTYLMPATDIVNGRARAVIPAGDIDDNNGYRLRVVGTLNGQPALLAFGNVMPIAAAGLEAIPEDIIDTINLAFEYGEKVELDVAVWQDTGKGSPYDLTSELTTMTAAVYDAKGGIMIMPFSVTVLDVNKVKLSLTVEQVNVLPASCWWSMVASTAAGATTLCEGTVTITGVVIPPLVETTVNYDYQKPDNADPVSGQIVHGNWTQNLLKVSKVTTDAADFSATLALARVGDQIIAGATTWTITAINDPGGWLEFSVLPVQQAAVLGVTPVTFRPPPPEV
jgi:hypothetical protein